MKDKNTAAGRRSVLIDRDVLNQSIKNYREAMPLKKDGGKPSLSDACFEIARRAYIGEASLLQWRKPGPQYTDISSLESVAKELRVPVEALISKEPDTRKDIKNVEWKEWQEIWALLKPLRNEEEEVKDGKPDLTVIMTVLYVLSDMESGERRRLAENSLEELERENRPMTYQEFYKLLVRRMDKNLLKQLTGLHELGMARLVEKVQRITEEKSINKQLKDMELPGDMGWVEDGDGYYQIILPLPYDLCQALEIGYPAEVGVYSEEEPGSEEWEEEVRDQILNMGAADELLPGGAEDIMAEEFQEMLEEKIYDWDLVEFGYVKGEKDPFSEENMPHTSMQMFLLFRAMAYDGKSSQFQRILSDLEFGRSMFEHYQIESPF